MLASQAASEVHYFGAPHFRSQQKPDKLQASAAFSDLKTAHVLWRGVSRVAEVTHLSIGHDKDGGYKYLNGVHQRQSASSAIALKRSLQNCSSTVRKGQNLRSWRIKASQDLSSNGSATASSSNGSTTTETLQVAVEELGTSVSSEAKSATPNLTRSNSRGANASELPPPSEAKSSTPTLTRSNSRGADAEERFINQLKRVNEAANINGRVGYVARSSLRLPVQDAVDEISTPEVPVKLPGSEIVLKAEEIQRLTGKTKKGIKKGLKKLVERNAQLHGHHNAAKLVTTDWTDFQTRSSTRKRLMIEEAWRLLRGSIVKFEGEPVGTVAAADPSVEAVNYDQVFIRDFVPSALAFMMEGEPEIVKNFLLQTLQLQSWDKTMDCFSPGEGLMPASFKAHVRMCSDGKEHERLDADFGEAAIGRVAPVDSGLWWIILLRAYLRKTKDEAVQNSPAVQKGIRLVLKLILRDGFDMFPTLLVPDGSCMIDRRMGIDGHPLEIQSLYFAALRCAREMLNPEDNEQLLKGITARLSALSFHLRQYYWLDFERLNEMYRYQTEEYSEDAANKFNIYPESLPSWLMEWMPEKGGYFIGGVAPAQLDFRVFTLGNCWAILSSLATPEQTAAILDLYEQKWGDLIADMPLKICYPAMVGEEWRIVTGCDPKNTAWSYHNGGSWPTLLWHFTAACIKGGRPELARRAMDQAEKKLAKLEWPEYFDGVKGNYVGKQARKFQTWTIAGFLVARQLLDNPEHVNLFACEDDTMMAAAASCIFTEGPPKVDVWSDSD